MAKTEEISQTGSFASIRACLQKDTESSLTARKVQVRLQRAFVLARSGGRITSGIWATPSDKCQEVVQRPSALESYLSGDWWSQTTAKIS